MGPGFDTTIDLSLRRTLLRHCFERRRASSSFSYLPLRDAHYCSAH